MSRNVDDLHPRLQSKIRELKSVCQKQGLIIGISECLRTSAEQDELYAKGRTVAGNIVTNARGSSYSSQHQWGIAADFYRNDGKGSYNENGNFFERVGSIAKSIGLGWGGDWTSPKDKPHVYLPDWGSTPSKLKAQYKNPNAFFSTWNIPAVKEDYHVIYTAHSADYGWGKTVSDGTTAGIKGKCLESVKIDAGGNFITVQAHVQDIGWMSPVSGSGIITVGTTGQNKPIEAIKITCEDKGLTYKVHTLGGAWGKPVWNGAQAGTTGRTKALDMIQITF